MPGNTPDINTIFKKEDRDKKKGGMKNRELLKVVLWICGPLRNPAALGEISTAICHRFYLLGKCLIRIYLSNYKLKMAENPGCAWCGEKELIIAHGPLTGIMGLSDNYKLFEKGRFPVSLAVLNAILP